MNNNILITLLVVVAFVACNNKRHVFIDDLEVYKIEKVDDVLYWDDFVEKIDIIPLETNANSLVGVFHKGIVTGSDIYVFDFRYQILLNFDIAGNFKKRIGGKGKGPEEYFEIRDFCIVDDDIYILDYKKIHRYSRITGKKEDTWSFDTRNSFNPVSMFVFDKNNYFLWNIDPPSVVNSDQGEYYRMHKMKEGKALEKFFKYEYPLTNAPWFYMLDKQSCYLRPIDGEDIIYKLTKDSLCALFKIDFGRMAITVPEIEELTKSPNPDEYINSNKFKSISTVLEVKDYIFFTCIGPESKGYQGLISKRTGNVKFGKANFINPRFFFSDGTFLYGYYEPHTIDLHKANNRRSCFDSVWLNSEHINIDDNVVIVRVLLK